MKKWMLASGLLAFSVALTSPHLSLAQEDSSLEQEELLSEHVKDKPEWVDVLKSKHHLSDSQIQTMRDGGLTYPQMAMASRLSEKSGRPVDDIIKMRNDENMGWGKIAKELGVSPKEIGQSVAALRHEIHMDRKIAKAERQEARRAEKAAKKAERMGKKNH